MTDTPALKHGPDGSVMLHTRVLGPDITPNQSQAPAPAEDEWSDEELIDLIGDAISDSMDLDWTATDGAIAVLAVLEKERLIAAARRKGG